MKNPKWKCANDTGTHKVKFGGKFLTQWDGYHLTLEQSTGGTISADKLKGYQEQSANLSYTANQDYYFNGWESTGAPVVDNKVEFTQDTTARAKFNSMNASGGVTGQYNDMASFKKNHYTQNTAAAGWNYYPVSPYGYGLDLPWIMSANGNQINPIVATKTKLTHIPAKKTDHWYFNYTVQASAYDWVYHWGNINDWELDQSDPTHQFHVFTNGYVGDCIQSGLLPVFNSTNTKDLYIENGTLVSRTVCVPYDWTREDLFVSYVTNTHFVDNSFSDSYCTRVSCYMDGNFICSAMAGKRDNWFMVLGVGAGIYSGTNDTIYGYYVNEAVSGSCYLGWRGFSSESDARLWATN